MRVYGEDGTPGRVGRGVFAAALTDALPLLPVEEEGRLTDAGIRENFIERVFAAARWRRSRRRARGPAISWRSTPRTSSRSSPTARGSTRELGRLVAGAGPRLGVETLQTYGTRFAQALAVRATRARHVNVLQHLAGFLKRAAR